MRAHSVTFRPLKTRLENAVEMGDGNHACSIRQGKSLMLVREVLDRSKNSASVKAIPGIRWSSRGRRLDDDVQCRWRPAICETVCFEALGLAP